MKKIALLGLFGVLTLTGFQKAQSLDQKFYWIKIAATDKFQRSIIANTGASIEIVKDDYVIAYGSEHNLNEIKKVATVIAASDLLLEDRAQKKNPRLFDFPTSDTQFHNYSELTTAMSKLASENKDLVKMFSIGKTNEGRDIYGLRITKDFTLADQKPAVIYMGGHHAREHLSVEIPLEWAQYLMSEYKKGNQRIVNLIASRDRSEERRVGKEC